MTALRLQVSDPAVWAHTLRAIEDSATRKPLLKVKCARCGAELAQVGITAHGPLFTSSWKVPIPAGSEAKALGPPTKLSGPAPLRSEIHGALAVLALPPDLPAEYPDLLVRCARHGDAVLDRREALRRLPADGAKPLQWRVTPGSRQDYEWPPPDVVADSWAVHERHSTAEWQFGAVPEA